MTWRVVIFRPVFRHLISTSCIRRFCFRRVAFLIPIKTDVKLTITMMCCVFGRLKTQKFQQNGECNFLSGRRHFGTRRKILFKRGVLSLPRGRKAAEILGFFSCDIWKEPNRVGGGTGLWITTHQWVQQGAPVWKFKKQTGHSKFTPLGSSLFVIG